MYVNHNTCGRMYLGQKTEIEMFGEKKKLILGCFAATEAECLAVKYVNSNVRPATKD